MAISARKHVFRGPLIELHLLGCSGAIFETETHRASVAYVRVVGDRNRGRDSKPVDEAKVGRKQGKMFVLLVMFPGFRQLARPPSLADRLGHPQQRRRPLQRRRPAEISNCSHQLGPSVCISCSYYLFNSLYYFYFFNRLKPL